jgi:hypothetical protein
VFLFCRLIGTAKNDAETLHLFFWTNETNPGPKQSAMRFNPPPAVSARGTLP